MDIDLPPCRLEGRIMGVRYDESAPNSEILGGEIQVFPRGFPGGNRLAFAAADSSGRFHVDHLPPGDYVVRYKNLLAAKPTITVGRKIAYVELKSSDQLGGISGDIHSEFDLKKDEYTGGGLEVHFFPKDHLGYDITSWKGCYVKEKPFQYSYKDLPGTYGLFVKGSGFNQTVPMIFIPNVVIKNGIVGKLDLTIPKGRFIQIKCDLANSWPPYCHWNLIYPNGGVLPDGAFVDSGVEGFFASSNQFMLPLGNYKLEVRYGAPKPLEKSFTVESGDQPLVVNVSIPSQVQEILSKESKLFETNLTLPTKDGKEPSSIPANDVKATTSSPFTVTGLITDSSGKPMSGVTVRAATGWATLRGGGITTTSLDGRYTLHFGPGMYMKGPAGKWGVGYQAAEFFAEKPGYYERNLSRHADWRMAGSPEAVAYYKGKNEKEHVVVYPNQPRELNFVMVPAATITGRLVSSKGEPIPNKIFSITGKEQRPASSVYVNATTDQQGRFSFDGIPTFQPMWFVLRADTKNFLDLTTDPINFSQPDDYEVELVYDSNRQTLKSRVISQNPRTSPNQKNHLHATSSTKANVVINHFVRLVVARNKMTFEGRETTWEDLPRLLKEIPDRPNTVLELAFPAEIMVSSTGQDHDLTLEARAKAARLAQEHGFAYLSDIGLHMLGSRGTARFEAPLEMNKDIPTSLTAGTTEKPDLVKTQWVRFEASGNSITAKLHGSIPFAPKSSWHVRIELLNAQGTIVGQRDIIQENSGIIKTVPEIAPLDLQLLINPLDSKSFNGADKPVRFVLSIDQFPPTSAGWIYTH